MFADSEPGWTSRSRSLSPRAAADIQCSGDALKSFCCQFPQQVLAGWHPGTATASSVISCILHNPDIYKNAWHECVSAGNFHSETFSLVSLPQKCQFGCCCGSAFSRKRWLSGTEHCANVRRNLWDWGGSSMNKTAPIPCFRADPNATPQPGIGRTQGAGTKDSNRELNKNLSSKTAKNASPVCLNFPFSDPISGTSSSRTSCSLPVPHRQYLDSCFLPSFDLLFFIFLKLSLSRTEGRPTQLHECVSNQNLCHCVFSLNSSPCKQNGPDLNAKILFFSLQQISRKQRVCTCKILAFVVLRWSCVQNSLLCLYPESRGGKSGNRKG